MQKDITPMKLCRLHLFMSYHTCFILPSLLCVNIKCCVVLSPVRNFFNPSTTNHLLISVAYFADRTYFHLPFASGTRFPFSLVYTFVLYTSVYSLFRHLLVVYDFRSVEQMKTCKLPCVWKCVRFNEGLCVFVVMLKRTMIGKSKLYLLILPPHVFVENQILILTFISVVVLSSSCCRRQKHLCLFCACNTPF